MKNTTKKPIPIPFFGVSFGVLFLWVRSLKFSVYYISRLFVVFLFSVIDSPFRLVQKLFLVNNKNKEFTPVFILGQWRSGTTMLHEYLCNDVRVGSLKYIQGFLPHSYRTNFLLKWIIRMAMPRSRPMDNMKILMDSPQECDLVMLARTGKSMYSAWMFPNRFREIFSKNTFNLSDSWWKSYKKLLNETASYQNKNMMIMKSPPHMGRIPTILKHFPNAKFIYISRNPYEVFASQQKLYKDAIPYFQLNDFSRDIDDEILWSNKQILDRYKTDKNLLNSQNLAEVSFVDLVNNPINTIQKIYKQLEIDAEPDDFKKMRDYISKKEQREYKSDKYEIDSETRRLVDKWWGE